MRYLASFVSACVMLCALAGASWAADAPKKEGDFAALMAEQQKAQHVQAWRRYALLGIPTLKQAPVIDGNVDEREWSGAATLGYMLHMANSMQEHDRNVWYMGYTDTHLYMAFQVERPESARKPSAQDFAEILLDITHGHSKYHNIAFNMDGEKWTGIGPNVDKNAWNPKYEYKATETAYGWQGEWAIAFTEFHGYDKAPAPGTIWGADFVRNEHTPTDRLAHWAWRSVWGATKDLSHLVFTGKPVAVRMESIGWMPQHKKMGFKIAVSNFGDQAVSLGTLLDLRKADRELAMQFLPALDSAFTENLDAAIGAQIDEEINRSLKPFVAIQEASQPVEVPAGSTKLIELSLPDEPGNYLAGFKLTEGDSMLAAANVPFIVTVPLNIDLRSYLYSAGLVAYSVDLRRVQDKMSESTSLQMEARLGKDGAVVATATQAGVGKKDQSAGELSFKPESGATYYVTATLKDGDKVVATNSTPLMVPAKADWIGNQTGRSKIVPRPWTPLVADAKKSQTLLINYDWSGKSIFPGIKVKGREIFAQPLDLAFKDGSGAAAPVTLSKFEMASSDIEQAVYAFEGKVAGIGTLSGKITVSFDGFMWYDVTLTPDGTKDLGACIFTATLHNEFARIYTRGRIAEGEGDHGIPGTDCGGIPPAGITMPFTFQTWVGYVEGGLQWYCENARNWYSDTPKETVRIEPGEKTTSLVVRYVDKTIKLEKPIDWHFGLMPTPAKTVVGGPEEHAYFQVGAAGGIEPPDPALKETDPNQFHKQTAYHELVTKGFKELGVKSVILFSGYNDMFGYPGMKDPQKKEMLHKYVKYMHAQGIKVLVYNGWGMSTECDEWNQFGSELVNLPLKNSGYNSYWASPVSLYADLFVQRVADHMKEFDLDGIYMDSTLGINYSEHPNGMAWVDDKGKDRGSYPVKAMREFALRLYKVLNHELGKDAIFYSHHSPAANVCVENFVNVRCPSEFAQWYEGPLDQAFVDFFLAKNGGIQYGYYTELTNKNWMKSITKSLNELNAIAVPAGVGFKAITYATYIGRKYDHMDQPQDALWKAFGWLDSRTATHYPWWADDALITVTPSDGTLSAVWTRKGDKALVCVSNLPNEARDLSATLNLEGLGFKDVQAQDAITGEAVTIEGGTFKVSVQPQRWRLIKVWAK